MGLNNGEVRVSGSFRPNGASAVSATNNKGVGFTVARTSLGLYTLTFADKFPTLISATAAVRDTSGRGMRVRIGDYDASAKTLKLYTVVGAPRFIPLDIHSLQILSSNDYINSAGGLLAKNTDPVLERTNAATDIATRVKWAANSVIEVQFPPTPLPPEAVATGNAITVNLLLSKSGNTDTSAVVAVKAFLGIGDSNAGGNTTALASASLGKKTVTIASADTLAYPTMLNLALVPGTHANDAIYLHAAWLEVDTLYDLTSDANNVVNFQAIFGNLSFV